MKIKTWIWVLILGIALLLAAPSARVRAEEPSGLNLEEWDFADGDEGIIYLYEYKGSATKMRLPAYTEYENQSMPVRIVTSTEYGTIEELSFEEGFYLRENSNCLFEDKTGLKRIDFTGVNSSDLKYVYGMFLGCSGLEYLNLSGLDTKNATDMEAMFRGCSGLEYLNLSGLDTQNVTDMSAMFRGCTKLKTIDGLSLDTGNVTNMATMFYECESLQSLDLTSFDTSNVSDMSWMFGLCYNLASVDLSSFDTGNVLDMTGMFCNCQDLENLDLSNFDTGKVTDMSSMFLQCDSLKSLDISNFDTSKVTSMNGMFFLHLDNALTSLKLGDLDTSNVRDMNYMFWGCSKLTSLDLSKLDTQHVTGMSSMFGDCAGLKKLDLSGFDTGSVTDMERMFVDCASLEHVDLSGFDVRNVEEMAGMFSGCESLKSLDLSSFVPEQASDLSEMFSGCTSLTRVDLSNFHTGNVYTMEKMFESCESLTSLDLSAFDTGSVGVMDFMFWGCTSLASVDLSGFETPSLESMNYMFSRCSSLTKLDLSTFDTSNSYGIGMHGLISECTNLEYLDISSFDTSNGAGMDGMFGYNEYAEYEDEAITTPSLRTVVLGPKFTTWSSNCNNYHGVYSCELPSLANWTNGTVSLTTFELCEQYPSHAKEWAGVWRLEMPEGATRIYGSTRYKTSLQIADMLKEVRKIDKFGIVVLVDGVSFPDGLSASGLATMWRAPIITTNGASKKQYEAVNKYIRENLRENGWVYIIGGQNAIPDEAVASLSDYKCIRLAGNTRYQTNLEVLREIHDYSYGEILIANGQDFPDSLAASATGRPLLLVNGKTGKLTANQKEYLKECSKYNFTIIGGPTAISEELEAQIESIIGKPVDRVAGSTRYKTSTAIAGRFYPKAIRAVLGYGLNFPDALSAGPLAFVLKAPVILTASESSGAVKAARTYLQEKGIHYAYVMGGPKLIADKDVRSILGLGNDVEILVR